MVQYSRVIRLTVIADVICPWCYIGQKEMQRAIERCADLPVKFELEHRPFQLNCTIKEDDALDRTQWYIHKFGEEKFAAMQVVMGERAKQVGVDLNFGGYMVQTHRAHRLLLKAWQIGGHTLQQPLLESMYKNMFELRQNINDYDVLGGLAEANSVMSKDQAIEFLKSDECAREVEQMIMDARKKGITGVPFTIIDGKWAVSGGQSVDVFLQIFRKLAKMDCGSSSRESTPMTVHAQEGLVC